jgi:hypothetical protein
VNRLHVRRLLLACLSAVALGSGCFVVIGEIPEGSPAAAGGGAAGIGGSAGSESGGGAGDAQAGAAGGGAGSSGGSAGSSGGAASGGAGAECSNEPCDCDGDGFGAIGCAGDTGDDCDDTDRDAFPGQTAYFDHPRNDGSSSFDYDCDDKVTAKFTDTVTCSVAVLDCPNEAVQGYTDGIPQCGQQANFGHCKQQNLQCVKVVLTQKKQECR